MRKYDVNFEEDIQNMIGQIPRICKNILFALYHEISIMNMFMVRIFSTGGLLTCMHLFFLLVPLHRQRPKTPILVETVLAPDQRYKDE